MFIDWLSCYQDFEIDLPIVSKTGSIRVDFETGETSFPKQHSFSHPGSFSTSILIEVKHRRIYMKGNPSRYNRLDNVFGFTTFDQCVAVYNQILKSLGLPSFTKNTQIRLAEVTTKSGKPKIVRFGNGMVITEVHVTENINVGQGCTDAYLKALAMLPYRHSQPRLHANGKTVDWLSKLGNARELYPKVYEKANELKLHALPTVKRRFGVDSPEYKYISDLITYCEENGVVRFEQKFRSPFIKKYDLHLYGLNDLANYSEIHNQFLSIDDKLQVSAMDLQTISQTLLEKKICDTTRAANTTAFYAYNWMNGQTFDFSKSQVKTHRARLRSIGIDIAKPCNLLIFSPVIVKEVTEISKSKTVPPSFYKHPNHLSLVA